MSSNNPQTPSQRNASPFSFTPSPSQYLNYTSEPCSSPTPFPSHNLRAPTITSPYEYQLAHLGLKPAAADASLALKSDYRSFGTLTESIAFTVDDASAIRELATTQFDEVGNVIL